VVVLHNNQLALLRPEFQTLLVWFINNLVLISSLVGKSRQNSRLWLHLQIHPISVAAIIFSPRKRFIIFAGPST